MRHPTDGMLRRLLDEPAGVADTDREHVADCPICLSALTAAGEDAGFVGAALAADVTPDTEAGWSSLANAIAAGQSARITAPARPRRWHAALRRPAVVVLGGALLLTGAGVAAAADWLPIFRTEHVEPVVITEADVVALPDLAAYGDVVVLAEPETREVPDAAAVAAATGLPVPEVGDLPRGITGEPAYRVGGQASVAFTFSAEKAAQAAADAGATLPPPPAGMDGNDFRMVAGPGFAQVWPADSGLPGLVVARAIAPTGYSSGVPFEQARDYLLSLPGLPPDVVAQLRGIAADGTTLPLPLPAGMVTSSESSVHGTPAQVFTSRDGTMAGVLWVQDGIVTAVAGSLGVDEVLTVARGLR